jgi:hypothetical protein
MAKRLASGLMWNRISERTSVRRNESLIVAIQLSTRDLRRSSLNLLSNESIQTCSARAGQKNSNETN